MSVDLKRVSKGRLERAPRVLVYAADGVGKTSWAAGAPDPFFLDANKGSGAFDVQRTFVEGWDELVEWLDAIEAGQVKCSTVVLDSVTDIEAMCHAKLFGSQNKTVTNYEGGYGRGDDAVTPELRKLLARLERLWDRGKGVVIIAHARVKSFNSPDSPPYDRWQIAAREPFAAALRAWVDYVFFAQVQTGFVHEKGKPSRATTTGERFIYTRRCPAYDAKARGTAAFPERLPLSYEAFASAVRSDGARMDDMKREIDEMIGEIGDSKLAKEVSEYLKKYPMQIAEAHNRVKIRLTEKREAEESKVAPTGQQPVATA
jgi:hypothetical protein